VETIAEAFPRVQLVALVTLASSYLAPLSDAVTFVSRDVQFDGLHRLDLTARYRHPASARRSLRIFGRVNNVTDQTYFESGFRTPGRVVAGGAAIEF
jgi:outer membrane receptor protein involved in Fe transport